MNIMWLLRMARWARNPPSRAYRRMLLVVLGFVLVIGGIEYFLGWPEALTLEPQRRFWRP
ncbi:hypothetical protein SAMN04487859_101332 [Roseovarius lutimaris]|uniref:Uncharacterized protein n=2 Tax=Roseovarius lutimaris TaxID=1005928 RepID=A0A1I4YLH6_9RHOB|nr:hypothetical protein SAMN04487859_101332 [Roseovarius lutimaris]